MGSYEHVKNYRQKQKENIIYVMGGKCACCGYNRCNRALELHHLNPAEKEFTFAQNTNRAWSYVVKELPKTIMVCSNCHREIHDGLIKNESLVSNFNEEKALEVTEQIEKSKTAKINYCVDCGKPIDKKATRCVDCYKIYQQSVKLSQNLNIEGEAEIIKRPSAEELVAILKENNGNFSAVGRLFGLSGNAIVKWCQKYNLPYHSGDYKVRKDKQEYHPPKEIYMLDKNTEEILKEFSNCTEAARFLGNNGANHIGDVCRGKRKTAYGYKWKFKEEI